MSKAGRKAILAGNIGVPPLDLAEDIQHDTEVIFEMSSHQLEHITVAPRIAVILNVFPEHLDHYGDFTAYKMAKFNIGRMQPEGGKLLYNADDPIVNELVKEQAGKKETSSFSITDRKATSFYDAQTIICKDESGQEHSFPLSDILGLPGLHNVMNMLAAILVCIEKQLDDADILEGLKTYERLPHRLEYVGTYNGIQFYDDSIATIPEATIAALETFEHVDMLILGGYDRGLEYHSLYRRLSDKPVPNLIFMGDAGKRMHEEWMEFSVDDSRSFLVQNLDEVSGIIKDYLNQGDVCLLSPAAASYGMYRDFEERGEAFKKMAAAI